MKGPEVRPMQYALQKIGASDVTVRFRDRDPFHGKCLGIDGGWLICFTPEGRIAVFNAGDVVSFEQSAIQPASEMPRLVAGGTA